MLYVFLNEKLIAAVGFVKNLKNDLSQIKMAGNVEPTSRQRKTVAPGTKYFANAEKNLGNTSHEKAQHKPQPQDLSITEKMIYVFFLTIQTSSRLSEVFS